MFVHLYAVDCVSLTACYRSDPAPALSLTGCCQPARVGAEGVHALTYAVSLQGDCRRGRWHEPVATPSKTPTWHSTRHVFFHSDAQIIAKCETRQSLFNFKSIAGAADGIILSRGNLGLDVLPEKMALVQKSVISNCNLIGKPVIITRVVDTMCVAPRPTRCGPAPILKPRGGCLFFCTSRGDKYAPFALGF